ncbi:hypothetical protein [Tardiphaga sp. 839_C3_N1_4]|uniref:hypothetical protein n=1 Tax=Tardiphaga sp. 839_C3_N1_4 TaxID=3240761 RepID=UPI003F28617E
MNLAWEDIAHLLCSCGKDHCDAANHADGVSPERYAQTSGCESQEVYETAERIASYVNDLARLQDEGWKRTQAILADQQRASAGFQKIKFWWSDDKQWFCILSDDGVNQTTISLTVEEASLLSMNAEASETISVCSHDQLGGARG